MTTEPTSPTPKKRSRRWMIWTGSLLLLIAIIGGAIWGWFRYRVWPEETRKLLELKNLAVAYLENEKFADSDPLLEQLAAEVPKELLPARNLLISRLLAYKGIGPTNDPDGFAHAQKQALEALAKLQALEGETAIVHLLAGRLAEHSQDEEAQVKHFTKAAQLDASNPAAWTAVFHVARISQNPIQKIQAREALKRAYALRPDNLYLLKELLLQQTALKDAQVADTLRHARELMRPFAEAILRFNHFDLLNSIDLALEALNPGNGQPADWDKVHTQVQYVNNAVKGETVTQRDYRRVVQHELEYVIRDFSPAFYKSAYLPAAIKAASVPVVFQPIESAKAFANLSDVRHAVLVDFDLDGSLDVLIVRDASVEVFGRDSQGDWQALASLDLPAGMQGVIAADLDRDHQEAPTKFQKVPNPGVDANNSAKTCLETDPDLCVYGEAGMLVLKNQFDPMSGRRTLEVVPQSEKFQKQTGIRAATFADLDQDGDLDLVASGAQGISLWLNLDNKLGPNGFEEITARSALPPTDVEPLTIIPVDWDRNVAMDLILVGQKGPVGWLENIHHGRFRWLPFEKEFQANAAALIDADGNASWDLLTASEAGISLEMTRTPAASVVTFQESRSIDPLQAESIKAFDYDNDGLMDFVAMNSDGVAFFHGLEHGHFEPSHLFQTNPATPKGCDTGDLDGDGDLDLLVFHETGVSLFDNQGGNANHWIDIALRADENPQHVADRCNMHGIGSLLELRAGGRYQPMVVTGAVTHFGLGTLEKPDMVRVLWTNGIPANIVNPPRTP